MRPKTSDPAGALFDAFAGYGTARGSRTGLPGPRRYPHAARDRDELHAYVFEHDSPASAERLLDRILDIVATLEQAPERVTAPRELRELGIDALRQVYIKPYRIVYRQSGDRVVTLLIVDGRRDMRTLLACRLFG